MRKFLYVLFAAMPQLAAAQQPFTPAQLGRIDALFAPYAAQDVPGCALAISRRDTVVLERAWGSANLEHGVAITPATIFEAGSVSKQFTAAAVIRLAQQGKLSLDDDVRKYVPELPTYDAPITIRHLIHHTSGLRDWGTVMSMAGWPRGTRTYTHAHVLDIVSRQRSLNYPVGTEYLYSNSNYNLLAMIAERVSGKTLAEFTRTELFEPLGMTSTGWRDDYTRVVRGRAQAYAGEGKQWQLQMPFENVYGNSSLLTTVGDLLKWNANLGHQKVGGKAFVDMQQRQGRLRNGREIQYAGGVSISDFRGTREVSHDGATAGYRAFLARYPDAGYAVALLCNAGNVSPTDLAHKVMEVVLPDAKAPAVAVRDTIGAAFPSERLASVAGLYRLPSTDALLNLAVENTRVRIVGGPLLVAISDRHFTTPSGLTHLVVDPKRGKVRAWVEKGDTIEYARVERAKPAASFGEYVGTFYSAEADATVSTELAKSELVLVAKPSSRRAMTPAYLDAFSAQGSIIRFTRGRNGRVDGFVVTSGRARQVRFDKTR